MFLGGIIFINTPFSTILTKTPRKPITLDSLAKLTGNLMDSDHSTQHHALLHRLTPHQTLPHQSSTIFNQLHTTPIIHYLQATLHHTNHPPSSVTSSSNNPSATTRASNSLWNMRMTLPPWGGAMQHNAMQCNAIQCNIVQCNAIQCNKIQCNTIQYNAL